jgi:hypothetical protein
MTIEETIKEAMARMIERRREISGVVVTGWEEEIISSWNDGCDTCGYGADDGTYEVTITFTKGGGYYNYTHEGTFAELIKELDK